MATKLEDFGHKKDEPPKRKEDKTLAYVLGDVGPKGQAFDAKIYKPGDKVNLTPAEARNHQDHGVPLTLVDETDRPQELN